MPASIPAGMAVRLTIGGFAIAAARPGDFIIGPGHYYVDDALAKPA